MTPSRRVYPFGLLRRCTAIPLLMELRALPRKPNYDFERRERERNKEAESARKAKAKADKKASDRASPDMPETGDA